MEKNFLIISKCPFPFCSVLLFGRVPNLSENRPPMFEVLSFCSITRGMQEEETQSNPPISFKKVSAGTTSGNKVTGISRTESQNSFSNVAISSSSSFSSKKDNSCFDKGLPEV